MTLLRRILAGAAITLFASALASADIIPGFTTATGSIASLSAPPNPNTSTVSFAQFDSTDVNATIQSNCPAGFTCSNASLYEIDFGLTGTTSGSLDIVNINGTSQAISCFAGDCTTSATSGVAAQGTLSLSAKDPNNKFVLLLNNTPTFSVATNSINSGTGFNFLSVAPGTTSFSGTGTATVALHDVYDSTHDATFAADSALYIFSGPTFNANTNTVTLNLNLNGASQLGSTPAGVSTANNIDTLSSGTVTVNYLYTFSETAPSGIPEPATMALLGGALLGLGIFGKKLKKD